MRKIVLAVFIVLFLLCHFSVWSQIDTLRGRMPYLHYNYYDSTWCQTWHNSGCNVGFVLAKGAIHNGFGVTATRPNGTQVCDYNQNQISSEVAIRMEMDSQSVISGLLFGYSFDSLWIGEEIEFFPFLVIPKHYTADYIFNIYNVDMSLIWSDTVATEDLSIDCYMEAGFDMSKYQDAYHHWYTTGQGGYEAPAYIGMCKIVFDTEILVPDTFFIGITTTTLVTPESVYNDTVGVTTIVLRGTCLNGQLNLLGEGYGLPYETRRYRISQSVGEQTLNWADEECHWGVQTCIYPILVLPCNEVTGLRYEPLGSTGTIAFVQWDGEDNHAGYEISYGPHGTPPGEGTVIQTRIPQTVLSQLNRTTRYDVYVRARCDYDTTRWSAWSDTMVLHIASYGIDDIEVPEVTLSPNPTTGTLTVRCGAEIEGVELYDMQGRVVSGQWSVANGQCVVLDLAALPAGSYTVVVRTAKGMTAKQVVVL